MAKKRLLATSIRNRNAKRGKDRAEHAKTAKRKKAGSRKKNGSMTAAKTRHAFGKIADFEDIVAQGMIGNRKQELPKSALATVEAIYSSSPGLERIAYKHGFSLGKNIYSKSDGTLSTLLAALGNGGLENMLYYPFDDSFVITASGTHAKGINRKMHIYESGLIAGYLTSATGTQISVAETECEYNGDGRCRFVSSSGFGLDETHSEALSLNQIISDVSEIAKIGGNVSASYFASAILPMADHPSAAPLSDFFYIAGSRLAGEMEGLELGDIAKIAGASSIRIAKEYRHVPRLVRIRYAPESSIGPYVDAAASAVAGYLKQRYSYEPEMRRKVMKDNSYLVELYAKPATYKKM